MQQRAWPVGVNVHDDNEKNLNLLQYVRNFRSLMEECCR